MARNDHGIMEGNTGSMKGDTTSGAVHHDGGTPLSGRFVDMLLGALDRIGTTDLDKAKDCLLDHLGVTLAGAVGQEERYGTIARIAGSGGAVPVIGSPIRADLFTAALLNGIGAHQLELDDGHRYGMVHPGATVISALLPLAHARGCDGEQLLRGIIVGYEATIRLAMALQPALKLRGHHATGVCGTIGTAMGAAVMLQLSRAQMLTALAAAATQAAGLLEVIREGSELKAFNAGQAAMHGLVAATMGAAGFAGPADVLGGKQGLLTRWSDAPDIDKLLGTATEPLAIHGIYVKPHAACRHAHPAIDAALTIRRAHGLDPAAVTAVQVHTYGLAVHLHDHRQVQGSADARMSTPYGVAAALCAGEVGMAQFASEALEDHAIQRIMNVVQVREDAAMSARVPGERGARVEVFLHDGQAHQAEVALPKGEPENPLSPEEFLAKFQALARFAGRSAADADRIIRHVRADRIDLSELFRHL